MKYNPTLLFDVKLLTNEDGSPHVDIACSMGLLKHVLDCLNKHEGSSMKREEVISFIYEYITDYAFMVSNIEQN
ncbi:hypothetical protein CMI47_13095 [Candidatus Pacearchaeota archaeon]|nr:hypothetical protein [Candidatus Pacearchaeota archaeon]|tara:strand:- start:306 stop:527 length:222 start_codon:yes stop_codon:yes gene_type:complete